MEFFGGYKMLNHYFPFVLRRLEKGGWVVANRKYKPIGFNTRQYIDYEAYPVTFKFGKEDRQTLLRLSCDGDIDGERIYLYNYACNPLESDKYMRAYLQRLSILMSLTIRDVGD